MSQQPLSTRILAGAITFIGLGFVWMAIASNLPSQQELSAKESPQPPAHAVPVPPLPEPVLDLSIPGVPATPPASETPPSASADRPSVSTRRIVVQPRWPGCGVRLKSSSSVRRHRMGQDAANVWRSARNSCQRPVIGKCGNAWSGGKRSGVD